MNNKGFTLVELLAVLAVLAIISVVAVPNVTKSINNNKKEQVYNDSIRLIALSKYEIGKDSDLREQISLSPVKKYLRELDLMDDISKDSNNNYYDRNNSYVTISKDSNSVIKYCVYLKSTNFEVSNNGECVEELSLLGDNGKQYVKILKVN